MLLGRDILRTTSSGESSNEEDDGEGTDENYAISRTQN
jgi:hypothetical protein